MRVPQFQREVAEHAGLLPRKAFGQMREEPLGEVAFARFI
jgi:hypothetical protein